MAMAVREHSFHKAHLRAFAIATVMRKVGRVRIGILTALASLGTDVNEEQGQDCTKTCHGTDSNARHGTGT